MNRLGYARAGRFKSEIRDTVPVQATVIFLIVNAGLLVITYLNAVPLLWWFTIALWTCGVFYCYIRLYDRIFALMFLASFFLFLLSRPFMALFFGVPISGISPPELDFLGRALMLGLVAFLVPFFIFCTWRPSEHQSSEYQVIHKFTRTEYRDDVQRASIRIFWILLPGAIFSFWSQIRFVRTNSYIDVYTESFARYSSNLFHVIANYMADGALIALIVFLATSPALKKTYFPMFIWLVLTGLLLLAGQRRDFLLAAALFIGYTVIRGRERGGTRKKGARYVLLGLALTPALASLLNFVGSSRGLDSTSSIFSDNAFVSFIYGQGVSVNTLVATFRYENILPDQFYLAEFLRTGLPARFLEFEVLQGNSIERALEGGSLSHSLSRIVLGDSYLAGISTGTSYLAEGYATWGYFGILVVSFVYAILIFKIGKYGRGPLKMDVVRLLIVQSIIWAPRGSTTGFMSMLLSPSTIATCGLILLIATISQSQIRRRNGINSDESNSLRATS